MSAKLNHLVAVTGASGHLGANLIRALLALGRPVRALVHRDRRALDGLDLDVVEADIRNLEDLREVLKGIRVVYHLAANVSFLRDHQDTLRSVNVLGTENAIQVCLENNARLIHFSSIHALEPSSSLEQSMDESCPLASRCDGPPYDRSKSDSERAVRAAIERGLDAVIVNPTGVIGPHDFRLSHLGEAIVAMANGSLLGLIPGGFDWVDARDVVAAAIEAERGAPRGARYVLSGHWATVRDLSRLIEGFSGVPAPRFEVPRSLAYLAAPFVTVWSRARDKRPLVTRFYIDTLGNARPVNHQKASRELGYEPRPLRRTLWDALQWYERNGFLKRPLSTEREPIDQTGA
jgi:dihydroflavonol-4-reductase